MQIRTFRLITTLAVIGVVAVGASACGSTATRSAAPAPTLAEAPTGSCGIGVSTDLTKIPTVDIPSCAVAPTELQVRDVVAGHGDGAAAGDSVTVRYYGASLSTHQKFDASWDDGAPNGEFTVSPLGSAGVIDGWNQGLIGAKVGSRRLLVIPPALGYGAGGYPPAIAPNETLVFVVDVVAIH